jgi:hypothetical protein
MATATAPRATSAPTEAEIREAIELRCELWPQDSPTDKLVQAIGSYGDFMYGPAAEVLSSPDDLTPEPTERGGPGDIWADLRPSEARDLDRFYQVGLETALAACEAVIADAFTSAALRFAELHPDAPRAQVAAG